MNDEIATLRRRVAELESENQILRAKVTFFERAPWMRDGIRGEQIVAELVGGSTTPVNERFDIVTTARRVRIEVKYSHLNRAVAGIECYRWQWAHIFGFDGGKVFDSLILVGDTDSLQRSFYRDRTSPYIFFDIPYARVSDVVRHTSRMIQITTNPRTARTEVARRLFNEFQITPDDLIAKYRSA